MSSKIPRIKHMHLPALTIRTRLSLWSAGMIAAVYLTLAATVFWGLVWLVQTEVDGLLEGQLQELIARVHQHHDNLTEAEREIREELGRRLRLDFRFRVLDKEGQQLLTSDPTRQFPLLPDDLFAPTEKFVTLAAADGYPAVRVHRLPIEAGDRQIIAEVTYSLDQMYSNLWRYAALWLGTLPLVALLAGIGGWLLARRSLRPVAEMIANAKQIEGDPSGKRIEVRGTADELDQLADTLNHMLERIERHVGQIRQFTADASHELRSPLAALRGAAEVALTRDSSADEVRTVLENALDQYDRLTRIAEDLLLLARIDAHQKVLHLDSVSIDTVLQNAADLYAPIAENRNIGLLCFSSSGLLIEGDGSRLLQLVGNLIDNAVKNTPGGGRVELRVHHDPDAAIVTVKDTGIGIAVHHLPHVFDRFYRGDDSRDRSAAAGAGLGLSICKAIAELHGGSLSVRSREGHGTEISLRLPLKSKMNKTS